MNNLMVNWLVVIFQNKMCNTTFICKSGTSGLKIPSGFLSEADFSLSAVAGQLQGESSGRICVVSAMTEVQPAREKDDAH